MWGIFLGPDNRFIPEGEWTKMRDNNEMFLWDVTTTRRKPKVAGSYSNVYLTRYGEKRIHVGSTLLESTLSPNWWAFGMFDDNGQHIKKDLKGFATRRHAIVYMLWVTGRIEDPARY